jgi:hypothetical protein
MNRRHIPAAVLAKLTELSDAAEYLSETLIRTEEGIASARTRLSGNFRSEAEYDDLRATLKQMVDDLPGLRRRCGTAQSTYSACQKFLDKLPDDATLEPVIIDIDGHDLDEVRAKINAIKAELATLRAVPIPSADIEKRLQGYVEAMARPQITGIGEGEKLKVIWPGAGWDTRGPIEHRADPLALAALMFPDEMTAGLMREVERTTGDRKARQLRISGLESELLELAYVEEAICGANGAERSPGAPPQAVLGVKVVESKRAKRAPCAA